MATVINLDEYRISKDFASEVLNRCHRGQVTEATAAQSIGAVMRAHNLNYLYTPQYRITCRNGIITISSRRRRYPYGA